jgi:hypothetical protein
VLAFVALSAGHGLACAFSSARGNSRGEFLVHGLKGRHGDLICYMNGAAAGRHARVQPTISCFLSNLTCALSHLIAPLNRQPSTRTR